jgi:pimeloyl-ACP methyl ester carboxylesterase
VTAIMTDDALADEPENEPRAPLEAIGMLEREEVWVTDSLRHVELYTMEGLLTMLWHGDPAAENVVLTCGGAMGGLLGPAGGVFHELGTTLAAGNNIGTIRVGYRRPNHLPKCVLDVAAAADLANRFGARRFVTVGHSFGGAVAIQAGIVLGSHCHGVVTLSTQSAGCEQAAELGNTPLLLMHGERDELLPPETSSVVQMLAGHGELEYLPGAGHLLTEAASHVRERLEHWIPAAFAA